MINGPKFFLFLFYISFASSDNVSNSRNTAITRAIQKVGPAVASVNVEQNLSSVSFDPFFGFMFPREIYPMKTSGSGVIISPDGFLMTNHHVIENADNVTVTLSGGEEYQAEIIGSDETSDLALLKLSGSDFPYAQLDDSDDLISRMINNGIDNQVKVISSVRKKLQKRIKNGVYRNQPDMLKVDCRNLKNKYGIEFYKPSMLVAVRREARNYYR